MYNYYNVFDLVFVCTYYKITILFLNAGNPHFFNQLYSGLNAYGLAGSWLTETLNTNM